MSLPAGYAQILDLSRHMLALAKKQEWEPLAATEARRTQLLSPLLPPPQGLGQPALNEIASTIRQIQEIDQEILEYVMPWREHAAALLSRLEISPVESSQHSTE